MRRNDMISPLQIILLAFAFSSCGESDKYIVMINDVETLSVGSPVLCEGLAVGEITDMFLHKDSVAVEIDMKKGF